MNNDNEQDRISALARGQAQEADTEDSDSSVLGAEEAPDDAALISAQSQADLLKEQLEQRRIHNLILLDRSRFLREEQKHIKKYREHYSKRVFLLTVSWLIFSACAIIATGVLELNFRLSDTVLVAITGSALASVIGTFLVILKWLYPEDSQDKE